MPQREQYTLKKSSEMIKIEIKEVDHHPAQLIITWQKVHRGACIKSRSVYILNEKS